MINIIRGGIITFFFLIFVIARFNSKPKKCLVCGAFTVDHYEKNSKALILCRNHLVVEWKNDMQNTTAPMLVIEPDFETYPYGYLFGTYEDLLKWSYPKKDVECIQNLISEIQGKKCLECSSDATIAFVKKENFKHPFFHKILNSDCYLCKKCLVVRIEPLICAYKGAFSEGFMSPVSEEGVYHCQIY